MCLTSLHNIQQDLINFIPGFSSLLMQMIFFLLLKQTVPNSDTRYFRASVIYMYTNPMVMYELMRIRHIIHIISSIGCKSKRPLVKTSPSQNVPELVKTSPNKKKRLVKTSPINVPIFQMGNFEDIGVFKRENACFSVW